MKKKNVDKQVGTKVPELRTIVFNFTCGYLVIVNKPYTRWLIYHYTKQKRMYKVEGNGISRAKANKLLKHYLKHKRDGKGREPKQGKLL